MNKQPVTYMQTDSRWKKLPYRVQGETSTIGGSGCGPSAAAMAIETLTGKTFTPVDACKWSVEHGYKAKGAGTYGSYFPAQFKAFDIDCWKLRNSDIKPGESRHDAVKRYTSEGYYAIALMGKGLWTKGGHYILVWDWDNKVRINDSASIREERLNGDPKLFTSQVSTYWIIDAREYNKGDDDMTDEVFAQHMDRYLENLSKKPAADYAIPFIEMCIKAGIVQNAGTLEKPEMARPADFLTRQDATVMIGSMITK